MVDDQNTMTGIDASEVDALLSGRHGEPFALLGPHAAGSQWIIRALLPGAVSVELVDPETGELFQQLDPVHKDGLFAALSDRKDYRFRITWPQAVQETEDPYAFGPLLADLDLYLFSEGTHYDLSAAMGACPVDIDGVSGVRFAVWAPNARRVSVVGDFNAWDGRRNPMRVRRPAGVWEIFIPRLGKGERYKFEIIDAHGQVLVQKADPVARASEAAPATASIVASAKPFAWSDHEWTSSGRKASTNAMSIYEVHLESWLRIAEDGNRPLDWIEFSQRLLPYVKQMGFSHVELLPIMEHPFGGSWGYQPLGLFAPTGRFGSPEDFSYFVDRCHAEGIGVILDWVPAHFPTDPWGLARFDGSALYEHEDPREGFHTDWKTLIYNVGRNEVKGFLIASALEWLERYHVDALRVDAVASMLYRDYSRNAGEWIPNKYGGRENLEAVDFFKHLNIIVHERHPDALMIAEESTAWPGVTRPVSEGGLGFDLKWNMGWMHDTLDYMHADPIYRKYQHDRLTFGMVYAYTERFVLPLSHDEVVHGKGSLYQKMPGDHWQKLANLRAYFGYMWAHPGGKLLFMGDEIAQVSEWNHDASVVWDQIDQPEFSGVQRVVRDLNHLYRTQPALQFGDHDPRGFQWAISDDAENSIFAMLRIAEDGSSYVLAVSNMTPVARHGYRIGVPQQGRWQEVFNSDAAVYGGSNLGNTEAWTTAEPAHGRDWSISVLLPPVSTIYLMWKA